MAEIKICGLHQPQDIDIVNEVLPTYIGFVFAPSKRQVSAKQAERLHKKLDNTIIPVGVFVNAPIHEISRLYKDGIIRIAQLHGSESEEYIHALRSLCPVPIIKAISVEKTEDIFFWQNSSADYLLLDSRHGGSGKAFDWTQIHRISKPFFMAGGINTENISQALAYEPYCIDVSSGAESNGKKDKDKIIRLVQAVKGGSPHGVYTQI